VSLSFSEELHAITELEDKTWTLPAINAINEKVLQLTYLPASSSEVASSKVPELSSWQFTEFTEQGLKIAVSFTHPLYVASGGRDGLDIKVLESSFFISKGTNETMLANYTLDVEIPP